MQKDTSSINIYPMNIHVFDILKPLKFIALTIQTSSLSIFSNPIFCQYAPDLKM